MRLLAFCGYVYCATAIIDNGSFQLYLASRQMAWAFLTGLALGWIDDAFHTSLFPALRMQRFRVIDLHPRMTRAVWPRLGLATAGA